MTGAPTGPGSAVALTAEPSAGVARGNATRLAGLSVAAGMLAVTAVASVLVGSHDTGLAVVWQALTAHDPSLDEHVVVTELRIPRTVLGLVVGPALGLCGALIQAFTRNPLADPGVLGVNSGASFAVTVALVFLGVAAPLGYVWFALAGAAVVTVFVYALGSLGGGRPTPGRLLLAGVAINAALGALTSALTLTNRSAFDTMRFWGVGALGGRPLEITLALLPLIAVGVALALATARALNALALGDELAAALGVRIALVRTGVIVAVALLAGTATALAGPIAFVGLMVPHAVRWFVGPDQRWIFAYTIVVSPVLLLASDILGRVLLPTGELRVGLVTAIVGARAGSAPARTHAATDAPAVDFGYRTWTWRRGRLSHRWSRRSVVVCSAVALLTALLCVVSLGIGTYELDVARVVGALLGVGDDERARLLVLGWRMPRSLLAVACGVALALAGAVFQSVTRNPLGSPDIIGFSAGSYTGALVVLLVFGSTRYLEVALGSFVGGCVTAAVVFFLALNGRRLQPFRLIIMGIGVGALLSSLNSAMMMFVDVESAMLAAVWGAGSLNGVGYEQLWPLLGALLVLALALVAVAAPLRSLELGDDTASALGVRSTPVRAATVVIGVGLTAAVTAAAGPIAFVALAAPQIARRLVRDSDLALVPSALVGALLLAGSDVIAQRIGLPVGIVTASLGGVYLAWLLAREFRKRKRLG